MSRLDGASQQQTASGDVQHANGGAGWFDVAVLIEHELTGTAARRMVDMYQMKSTPLRYNLVRPLNASPRAKADQLLNKSVERMEALGARVTGMVSEQPPVDALSGLVQATRSQEVVVVTHRHRLASLLRRDLASQARARVALPLVHLVN
jgi:hypothetical protein